MARTFNKVKRRGKNIIIGKFYSVMYINVFSPLLTYFVILFQTIKDDEEKVDNLEKRNAVIERDVARYRERETILNRVNINVILVIMNLIIRIKILIYYKISLD